MERIKLIKCSNCGNKVQISDPQSLIELTNIIKTKNEKANCCDNPNYAPFSEKANGGMKV